MRASPARRRCGASRGASPSRSSGASWRIRRRLLAAQLDKEEPRMPKRRTSPKRSSRKFAPASSRYGIMLGGVKGCPLRAGERGRAYMLEDLEDPKARTVARARAPTVLRRLAQAVRKTRGPAL